MVYCKPMAGSGIERRLDNLTTLMESGFAALADDLAAIRERMATKADIAEMRLELHAARVDAEGSFRSLNRELSEINRRLDLLDRQFGHLKGVTREIDDIRDRVRGIEKHLGLDRHIAA